MSSESLHEPAEKLSPATIDRHRATVSLMEELEAVDWYDQRIDAATDEELKAILRHNRDEEKEHACHGAGMAAADRIPPSTSSCGPTSSRTATSWRAEAEAEGGEASEGDGDGSGDGSLGIGDLRGEEVTP